MLKKTWSDYPSSELSIKDSNGLQYGDEKLVEYYKFARKNPKLRKMQQHNTSGLYCIYTNILAKKIENKNHEGLLKHPVYSND